VISCEPALMMFGQLYPRMFVGVTAGLLDATMNG
jgi:hypothetical protein